jgi:hypothetical protein
MTVRGVAQLCQPLEQGPEPTVSAAKVSDLSDKIMLQNKKLPSESCQQASRAEQDWASMRFPIDKSRISGSRLYDHQQSVDAWEWRRMRSMVTRNIKKT